MARRITALVALVATAALAGRAGAQTNPPCRSLTFSYTADCLRVPGQENDGCGWHVERPDFGPQIAVWVESADRTTYVDTLLVTNATALFGIGNRPGLWDLQSGPRFPYGRRPMALPIWAHARGKTYPLVVMQNGHEGNLTFHEDDSSPEPHFCKPPLLREIVDAVTCASGLFRSDKGKLDPTELSFYPPRADLFDLGTSCTILPHSATGSCDPGDSAQYPFLNDVDAIAAATPAAGVATGGSWTIPGGLPPGDYALMVEVSKEFDTNATYDAPNAPNLETDAYGLDGNLGQPSVVYRVPFTIGTPDAAAATSAIFGYGDWLGETGTIFPPDATIGDAPGSGAGRLLITDGPGGPGRVHLALAACPPVDCATTGAPPPVPIDTVAGARSATSARIEIDQVGEGAVPVRDYEVRWAEVPPDGPDLTPGAFAHWTPAPAIMPATPGTISTTDLSGLAPETSYVAGVVAHGRCGDSPVTYTRWASPPITYTKLQGCFVATAAFGSELAGEVDLFRRLRDRAVAASGLARLGVEIYYRDAPAAARLLAKTDVGRALVRAPLRALAGWIEATATPPQ
jgi:hypothetical protein